MERQAVNPWSWQEQFAFVQANEVSQPNRVVYCAGQTSVDAEGRPLHPGDMSAQIVQSLDNLETVLQKAGLELEHVVRLSYYTTNMDAFLAAYPALTQRLEKGRCKPASTLLEVKRLAFAELLVEIEATACA